MNETPAFSPMTKLEYSRSLREINENHKLTPVMKTMAINSLNNRFHPAADSTGFSEEDMKRVEEAKRKLEYEAIRLGLSKDEAKSMAAIDLSIYIGRHRYKGFHYDESEIGSPEFDKYKPAGDK